LFHPKEEDKASMGFSILFRPLLLIIIFIASIFTTQLSLVHAGSFPPIFIAVIPIVSPFFLLLIYLFVHKRNLDRNLVISHMHGM
jgi:lipopolysaccharide export LptBFGC system permease protein LptF